MTIPNVTISWCEHNAKCGWCPERIGTGTAMVSVFYWNKGTTEHKGFNTITYFHPQCWVEQGLDYLKRNPYVPYVRKRSKLEPEQRKMRSILLRRKCSIEQRRRKIKPDDTDKVLKEIRLDRQVTDLMMEIAQVGGIPKTWLRLPI